jgi:hypothetical protein
VRWATTVMLRGMRSKDSHGREVGGEWVNSRMDRDFLLKLPPQTLRAQAAAGGLLWRCCSSSGGELTWQKCQQEKQAMEREANTPDHQWHMVQSLRAKSSCPTPGSSYSTSSSRSTRATGRSSRRRCWTSSSGGHGAMAARATAMVSMAAAASAYCCP